MKVLVVDDEEIARLRIKRDLSRWFESVTVVEDGESAWQAIQTFEYDLVITDWIMPGIDGITLCRMIRNLPAPYYIYVILLTTQDSKNMLVRGLEAGADDFIIKPYELDELRVRTFVGKRIVELERTLGEKTRSLLAELETSSQTLRDMLPDSTKRWGDRIKIDWLYNPSIYIGGDFFNILELDEQHLACYLLDVSGHGVSAALSAVNVSSLMHSSGSHEGLLYDDSGQPATPSLVASRLNQRFQCKGPRGFYFTLFYAVINLASLKMSYVRAGQTCPLVIRRQECLTISKGYIPIGFFPDYVYQDSEFQLEPGDSMVLYSDGVNETADSEGKMFGVKKIEEHFLHLENGESGKILERLTNRLHRFSGRKEFEDDVTVLLVNIIR